jgi:hypothetical protein
MKTTPTRETAARLTKGADGGASADSRPHPQIAPKPGKSDKFSHMNSVSITKAKILQEFVRFIVTTKLPKSR